MGKLTTHRKLTATTNLLGETFGGMADFGCLQVQGLGSRLRQGICGKLVDFETLIWWLNKGCYEYWGKGR